MEEKTYTLTVTELDEIDQWLTDNFGIMPGACSSIENLRHNTARMIAEALWPESKKEMLHYGPFKGCGTSETIIQ